MPPHPLKLHNLSIRRMIPSSHSFSLPILSLSAILLAVSCSRSGPSGRNSSQDMHASETVLPFTGNTWLRWDRPSRLAFVMGNLRGYWDGQGAGCGEAKILAQSLSGVSGLTEGVAEQMRFRCANKLKLSNRSFESHEEVVTDYYTRYPEDESIEIQDILEQLIYDSDGKLTAAEIHKRIRVIR
jgi:hypothetical protein